MSAIKLIVLPVVVVAMLYLVDIWAGIGTAMMIGAFISFGTPTAGLASTFADAYDGDTEGSVAYTLGSTILSVATIPVMYWLLSLIVG